MEILFAPVSSPGRRVTPGHASGPRGASVATLVCVVPRGRGQRLKKRARASKTRPPKTTKTRRAAGGGGGGVSNNGSEARGPTKGGGRKGERPRTDPEHGDGRLWRLLGAALDLVLGPAHARLLVLGELCVAPALLEGLGLASRGARGRGEGARRQPAHEQPKHRAGGMGMFWGGGVVFLGGVCPPRSRGSKWRMRGRAGVPCLSVLEGAAARGAASSSGGECRGGSRGDVARGGEGE